MAITTMDLILIRMKRPMISLSDYQYSLPESRIARYPLPDRDQSKLLVWNAGRIGHFHFSQLADFLPDNSALFFNNTKVISARLLFEKTTGGSIEIFLLNPADPTALIAEALNAKGTAAWTCAVGNARRWPDSLMLTKQTTGGQLSAQWENRQENTVRFTWTPETIPFAVMVEQAGAIPLPRYLKRDAEANDFERYQTVYSRFSGAVAAPTAGLHFTPAVLKSLTEKGIITDFLTLHVSAGTFLPIKEKNAVDHKMHEEEIIIHKQNIIRLLQTGRRVIAVGTTAMRTLESLYWYGLKLMADPEAEFRIRQDQPYQSGTANTTMTQALEVILSTMEKNRQEQLVGHTSIFIRPGYHFRVTDGLITNFHQPGSSLLLLVSAFVGDQWRLIYSEALDRGYRFLSYGDSSLLLPVRS